MTLRRHFLRTNVSLAQADDTFVVDVSPLVHRIVEASMVGADRQINVTIRTQQFALEPDGRHACGDPRVEVVSIRERERDVAVFRHLRKDRAAVIGTLGQAEIAVPPLVDVDGAMLEPGLGHDDGCDRGGEPCRREAELRTELLVAGPEPGHPEKRHRANRLRDPVPVRDAHLTPHGRTGEQRSIGIDHRPQCRLSQLGRDRIPIVEMHLPPEPVVGSKRIDGDNVPDLPP